jgi:arginine kinase
MPKSTHFDEDEQIEEKPFNFHEYLQEKGVIPNLKKAFEKLYEEENKPSDSVTFIRKILCETCPDQDDYLKAVNNLKEALDRIAELEKELALLKGSLKRTQSEYYMLLSVYFEALQDNKECKSLLKKHLTQQLIDSLQDLRTANKGNILDCLESGLENQDYVIGFYACDAEAYTLFAPLFDPIIEEYHGIKQETVQPTLDWGDICSLPDLDPENKYIQKIIISCERSVEGFPFNPLMNIEQYQEIREKLHSFCDCLSGEYKGTFYEVENLDKDMKRQLIGEKLLYSDDDKILKDANGLRYFPEGRGLFINGSKNFIIWCNHEDHLKITSIEKGANFSECNEIIMNMSLIISYFLN